MKQKLKRIFAAALALAAAADAAAGVSSAAVAPAEKTVVQAGFNSDLCSAYVYRNAVYNDELVFQPSVWMEVTVLELLKAGGNVWQNWNLTNRQRQWGTPNEMNETDFDLHVSCRCWESDDEEYSLELGFAHSWETYRDDDGVNELVLRLGFGTPVVGIYGRYVQAYLPVSACHFEVGLDREWNVGELLDSENDCLKRFTFGFDWNVNFGSGRFLTNYNYGPVGRGAYDPEREEYESYEDLTGGIGGTTIQGSLAYEVCEHFTVALALAFTTTLSDEAREYIDQNYCDSYRDLVWGGLQAKLDF